MRLTLRNLLRFLDQTNLRSIERSRLEELVEQSEKADAWIKRIDALRRSSEATAPSVECDDPPINRVAAYLDSVMGEEATIEFEQSMLSSDELLAEVASCHEIRESLRSEETPPIPILLRQSVYDIGRDLADYDNTDADANGDEVEDEVKVAALAASMEDLPYVDSKPDDPQPIGGFSDEGDEPDEETVSLDSLSRQAQKNSRLVMVTLLAVMAGLLGLTYWLGWQAGNQPRSWAGNPDIANLGKDKNKDESDSGDPGKSAADDTSPKNKVADSGDPDTGDPGVEVDPDNNSGQPGDEADIAAIFPENVKPDSEVGPVIEDENKLPGRPAIDPIRLADTAAEAPHEAMAIANITDMKTTLLRHDVQTQLWVRSATDAPVLEGSELIVLPGTVAELDFSGNLTMRVEGPARFAIGRRDVASGTDVIEVTHGRYAVRSTAGDVDLLIVRKDHRYRLNIPVPESMVNAEFSNYLSQGDDPREKEPARIDMFVVEKGRVQLTEGEQTWLLPESSAMARSDSSTPELNREATTGLIELPIARSRDYSVRLKETVNKNFSELSDLLNPDQSIFDYLVNLKSDVRQERRFAAQAWLASIGNYVYLIDFLNDEKNRNNWRSVIEAVRESILANPEFTNSLFEGLAQAGNEEREIMFKLLLGYTQEELVGGADEALVKLLDHDSLCVRVLAIERLRFITGGLAYGYTPNADRKARRRIIDRQWNKALKREEVRYSVAPALTIPDFSTVPPEAPVPDEAIDEESGDASGID